MVNHANVTELKHNVEYRRYNCFSQYIQCLNFFCVTVDLLFCAIWNDLYNLRYDGNNFFIKLLFQSHFFIMYLISFLHTTVFPRAKKPFELKYMQHIVIIYWLCIAYTLCQLKLFNVKSHDSFFILADITESTECQGG